MKVQNMVPEVYYESSRDFSYIGRILEVALNHMKTNADLVNSNLNTVDSDDLLNSLAYTLGFKPKHKYINKDLINVCSNFTNILKNKGTKYAIEECIKILLNSQDIIGDFVILEDYDNYYLEVGLPSGTKDIVLLEDLFDYILPTGWIYSIVNIASKKEIEDTYYFNESGHYSVKAKYSNIAQVTRPVDGSDGIIKKNTEDVSRAESPDNPQDHSQLWSNIVYKPDENNN